MRAARPRSFLATGMGALALVLCLATSGSASTTYYVNGSTGSDSNSGTSTSPYKTISRGCQYYNNGGTWVTTGLNAGDQVLVQSRDSSGNPIVYREKVRIIGPGTSASPIVLDRWPGSTGPIIISGCAVIPGSSLTDAGAIGGGEQWSIQESTIGGSFAGFLQPYFSAWLAWSPGDYDSQYTGYTGGYGGRVEMVFVDGVSYTQVLSSTAVVPGSFYVPEHWKSAVSGKVWVTQTPNSSDTLYIGLATGDSPSNHTIEFATRQGGLDMFYAAYPTVSDYITVRNVKVQGVATSSGADAFGSMAQTQDFSHDGAICIDGATDVQMQDCRAEWNNWEGFEPLAGSNLSAVTVTVAKASGGTGCVFNNNGNCGICGSALNSTFSDSQASNNGWRYGPYWQAGGIKMIPAMASCTFQRLTMYHNNGPGIWFDTDGNKSTGVGNNSVLQCVIDHNTHDGVSVEASYGPTLIENCLISNTQRGPTGAACADGDPSGNTSRAQGLDISYTSDVQCYYCTIVNSADNGISWESFSPRNGTYNIRTLFYNNIIAFDGDGNSPFPASSGYALRLWAGTPATDAANISTNEFRYNDCFETSPAAPKVRWWNGTGYDDNLPVTGTGSFQTKYSTYVSNNLITNPDFVDAAYGDFHFLTGSAAYNAASSSYPSSGQPTTDLDGVSKPLNSIPDIGAYECTGTYTTTDFNPDSADAYTGNHSPTANTGTATYLAIDGQTTTLSQQQSYLTFVTSGLTGTVSSAKLKLYNQSTAAIPDASVFPVYGTWTETGLTWNIASQTLVWGGLLQTQLNVPISTYTSFNLAPAITGTGNGTYSFGLTTTQTSRNYTFSSKENTVTTQRPVLEIKTR